MRIATASLRTGFAMTGLFYTLPFLFPNGSRPSLATPQSATPTAPLEGTPRGERHDAFEPAANLCRGALPLLGEVPSAHTGERGRRCVETAIREKKSAVTTAGRHRGRPLRCDFHTLFLLASALGTTLATPQALKRQHLAAARSRRGSDMPPACHSLPRRRFAT